MHSTIIFTIITAFFLLAAVFIAVNVPWLDAGGFGKKESEVERLFSAGETFDEFLRQDTVNQKIWRANYERAGAVIEENMARLGRSTKHWNLLVIAEAWCSDSYFAVPTLARLEAETENVTVRIVDRTQVSDSLWEEHLTGGRRAIPVVIVLDSDFNVRGRLLERPVALKEFIVRQPEEISPDSLGSNVRAWREQDDARSVIREIMLAMQGFAVEQQEGGANRPGVCVG